MPTPPASTSTRVEVGYTELSSPRTCQVKDCDREAKSRGFCYSHYSRWQRYGDPFAHVPLGRRGWGAYQLQWRAQPDEIAVERAISGDAPYDLLLPERRQLAIARLTKQGLSAPQIAARLGCTSRTVVRHRSRLRMAS